MKYLICISILKNSEMLLSKTDIYYTTLVNFKIGYQIRNIFTKLDLKNAHNLIYIKGGKE